MTEVEFKVPNHKKHIFENEFINILKSENITCNQWEISNVGKDFVVFSIPEYCINNFTNEQLDTLKSYSI